MRISRPVTIAAILVATAGAGLEARGKDQPRIREEITVRPMYPTFDREYFLTFSAPVALPGVSLGSGTYLFRRVRPDVIQVLSANRRMTYAMVQTIPTVRRTVTDSHVFILKGSPIGGAPHRLTAWFLPGNTVGQEILYPSARASDSSGE